MIIVDAHEDLAWNARTFGRDYRRSAEETRSREQNTRIPEWNGNTLLGWPEWVEGRVGVIFSTLFAAPERWKEGDWDILSYGDDEQASEIYYGQWEYYQELFDQQPDQFTNITSKADLERVIQAWEQDAAEQAPVGFLLLMVCA